MQLCWKPGGPREIESGTFRTRGQLLPCPPTTGLERCANCKSLHATTAGLSLVSLRTCTTPHTGGHRVRTDMPVTAVPNGPARCHINQLFLQRVHHANRAIVTLPAEATGQVMQSAFAAAGGLPCILIPSVGHSHQQVCSNVRGTLRKRFRYLAVLNHDSTVTWTSDTQVACMQHLSNSHPDLCQCVWRQRSRPSANLFQRKGYCLVHRTCICKHCGCQHQRLNAAHQGYNMLFYPCNITSRHM